MDHYPFNKEAINFKISIAIHLLNYVKTSSELEFIVH